MTSTDDGDCDCDSVPPRSHPLPPPPTSTRRCVFSWTALGHHLACCVLRGARAPSWLASSRALCRRSRAFAQGIPSRVLPKTLPYWRERMSQPLPQKLLSPCWRACTPSCTASCPLTQLRSRSVQGCQWHVRAADRGPLASPSPCVPTTPYPPRPRRPLQVCLWPSQRPHTHAHPTTSHVLSLIVLLCADSGWPAPV